LARKLAGPRVDAGLAAKKPVTTPVATVEPQVEVTGAQVEAVRPPIELASPPLARKSQSGWLSRLLGRE
jgi:hypothetical protein